MTIDNFIPTFWSNRLLKNLNDAHVYRDLLNTDYEGDIKGHGDTVKINSIGRVTIGTYTKNSNIDAAEVLDDSAQMLHIDQGNYYHFLIDSVDKAQQVPKLADAAMDEAAWGLADTCDAYVAALLAAGVATASQLTAATSVGTGASDQDAYEILVDLDTQLDTQNVPSEGRWAVVPPWFHGMLRKDSRFVSFGTEGNLRRLRGDAIGEAANFKVYRSNNVPVSGSAYTVLAGHKVAATFANQIVKNKVYEPELRFADAMKGLHVYGALVTRPYALASIACTQAS